MRAVRVLLILCLTAVSLTARAQSGKVESLGPVADASVPDTVKKVLEGKGYRVILDDGSVACEIWLRNGVASAPAQKDESGALYSQLAESAFFGVLSFPQAATDYRGEPIKPGAYSLRYELLPNDANHLGVAPYRDFLLLIPVAADPGPDTTVDYRNLVNLSRKATGAAHPGPLSMVQITSGSAPAVSKDEQDHWVFSAVIKLVSGGDLPFGLVVKGTAPQ
jgi:hypothetical protein